jgi:uncharacterized membrane protein
MLWAGCNDSQEAEKTLAETIVASCTPASAAVTYNDNVKAILDANCIACHRAPSPASGVRLDTYADSVAAAQRALSQIDLKKMPPDRPDAVTQEQLCTLAHWIVTEMDAGDSGDGPSDSGTGGGNTGGDDDSDDEETTGGSDDEETTGGSDDNSTGGTTGGSTGGTTGGSTGSEVTYTNTIKSIFDAKCIACHGVSTSQGGIRLDTYSNASTNASSALSEINGDRMPPGNNTPLTSDEVTALVSWIQGNKPQ